MSIEKEIEFLESFTGKVCVASIYNHKNCYLFAHFVMDMHFVIVSLFSLILSSSSIATVSISCDVALVSIGVYHLLWKVYECSGETD
jgi:hypothetical protein